jgi:hypothetical protein
MTTKALELYMYMGNSNKIIEWLKTEGVQTKQEIKGKLELLVGELTKDVDRCNYGWTYGDDITDMFLTLVSKTSDTKASLKGVNDCIEKVLQAFEN